MISRFGKQWEQRASDRKAQAGFAGLSRATYHLRQEVRFLEITLGMSTTFAIDDGSAVQGDSPTAEEDSIVYSRYSAMAVQCHRPPTPRCSRRLSPNAPSALRRASASATPLNDAQTATRCREALHWITTLPEGAVRIRVEAGRVTLEGTVGHLNEREIAAVTVRQLEGVTEVDNHIEVR